MSEEIPTLSIYLAEYEQLKQEQIHRISVRDNLIYVMLTVFGAVISYSLSDVEHSKALLILPWVALVLGWTYLLNDKKVSEIRQYIKKELVNNINEILPEKAINILSWENYHENRQLRGLKKIFQLFIDLIIFCFSGIASLSLYLLKVPSLSTVTTTIVILGGVVMLILAVWFIFFNEI